MTVDALLYKPDPKRETLSAVISLPGPVLSVNYLEPRVRAYRDFSTTLFPDMLPIDQKGFIYAY